MRFYNLFVITILTALLIEAVKTNQTIEIQIILIATMFLNLVVGLKTV